ncbi:hypothetical protein ACH4E7_24825 [Kitasatospora sp. NPDC018058]|uniref:hypothetical protein n=1 Tax=Kitasatospora sp. NPDC018058 TaxID=3364025 RepID=UPI0037C02040
MRADEAWVPGADGEGSLYLRPFMFASESFLGVRPADHVTYSVIACPAGPYFPSGVTGITLWVSGEYTRAGRGGTGAAKCGGNYASSLAPRWRPGSTAATRCCSWTTPAARATWRSPAR